MRCTVAFLISLALALAAAAVRPGAAPQDCEYSVSPVFIDLDGAAATGTITIDTQPGCPWTATTSVRAYDSRTPFFTVDAAAGTGPATLRYNVAEFRLSSPDASTMIRQGRVHVRWPTPTAGQDVVITQHAANCKAVFLPRDSWVSSETFGEAGGVGRLEVLAWEFIVGPWFIESAPDWITFVLTPLKILSFGDQSSIFVVRPNPSTEPRVGIIRTCSGTTITVRQSGRTARSGLPNVFNDLDGDGKADLAIQRARALPGGPVPTTPTFPEATLFVLRSVNDYRYDGAFSLTSTGLGPSFYTAEFDGDTRRDVVLPDDSVRLSSDGYGALGASAVPPIGPDLGPSDFMLADLLGRGKDDFIRYSHSTGVWSFAQSSLEWDEATGSTLRLPARLAGLRWGTFGDVPIAADFDGDRKADLCVWRPSDGRWYLLLSTRGYEYSGQAIYQWGANGDRPINGDFDGDGRNDLAVYRPANGTWYILQSTHEYRLSSAIAYQWGVASDTPVPADYDGDGRTDIAVWRPSNGTWYLLFSSTGYAYASAKAVQWGNTAFGDRPVTR